MEHDTMARAARLAGLWMSLLLLALPALHATTVLVNSQNYEDVMAASVYAAANGDTLAFAITPAQAVFVTHYYTSVKTDPVVYLEGSKTILPNMATLLRQTGLRNLTVVQGQPVQEWVADQFPRKQAILVGGGYGQDALSLAPYAALTKSPLFFVDEPSRAGPVLDAIASRGYASTLIYGQVASQLTPEQTAKLPEPQTIDTGSRYTNNMEIVRRFEQIRPARQAMFVSGYSFEKSMVDASYPIVLVGRSSVPNDLADFLKKQNITSGVVFSGDSTDPSQQSSIVDGMASLRALYPELAVFIKFGEGYAGVNQALPLMVMPLPSPTVSLQVLNLSYNVGAKRFELRVANAGDFIYLSSGVFVSGVGSADSSQISLAPNQTTTVGIPLDASSAIVSGHIPAADVTVNYGEDAGLLDNVDTVSFTNIPLSTYSDNSTLTLVRVTYSSDQKAFQLQMQGDGWVSGTLRFVIQGRPVVLDLPLQEIHGAGIVQVKYLLSSDEEAYVNGLAADYFLRTGSRSDVLLREQRGQSPVAVSRPLALADNGAALPAGSPPWAMVCIGVVLVVGALVAVRYFLSRQDSFE
ncbi:Uncharacterised protein [uncultured archaeon]|nr:Uncharacterised protein [uncultured archaeon]